MVNPFPRRDASSAWLRDVMGLQGRAAFGEAPEKLGGRCWIRADGAARRAMGSISTPKLLSKAFPLPAKHKVLCHSPSAPCSLTFPLQLSPDPTRQLQLTADVLGMPPSPTGETRRVQMGFGAANPPQAGAWVSVHLSTGVPPAPVSGECGGVVSHGV